MGTLIISIIIINKWKSLLTPFPFICMIVLPRIPSAVLNWNLNSEHSCLNTDLRGKVFIQSFSNKYDIVSMETENETTVLCLINLSLQLEWEVSPGIIPIWWSKGLSYYFCLLSKQLTVQHCLLSCVWNCCFLCCVHVLFVYSKKVGLVPVTQ